MLLSALKASREFGAAIASGLGVTPVAHEEREFEYGEHKARPLVDVRAGDAYVYVAESAWRAGRERERQAGPTAVFRRDAEKPRSGACHGARPRTSRTHTRIAARGTNAVLASAARSRIVSCSAGGRALVR